MDLKLYFARSDVMRNFGILSRLPNQDDELVFNIKMFTTSLYLPATDNMHLGT